MVALYQGTTLEPALSVHGPAAHPWDEKFTTEARNHGENPGNQTSVSPW